MRAAADGWFAAATSDWSDWPLDALLAMKGDHVISVVIPAKNEAATIGGIVRGIRTQLVDAVGLVDELVVIDSDCTDDTARLAAAEHATVRASRDVTPDLGSYGGKGEALWKSLFVTGGDLLVFIDADLVEWGTHFVTGLVGPLLQDPRIDLVKGFYDRVLDDGSGRQSVSGGRVTELLARPLLNLYWPDLAAVVQPLAGEWAIRRSRFESLSVPVGYGVELATLLDTYSESGLPAIAQVDLGRRAHLHQSEPDLAIMAAELLIVAGRRLPGGVDVPEQDAFLSQFGRHEGPVWRERPVPCVQRPAATGLEAYRRRRA